MFFIGVFGIENKEKEIETLNNISCKKCNTTVTGKLIKNFDFFHLFFIPIFKWNEKYYVVCNQCKAVYSIPKEKGKEIEHGDDIQITYWDLQEIYTDDYSNSYFGDKNCSNCGKKVDSSFKYCPHCGSKI